MDRVRVAFGLIQKGHVVGHGLFCFTVDDPVGHRFLLLSYDSVYRQPDVEPEIVSDSEGVLCVSLRIWKLDERSFYCEVVEDE